MEDRSARIFETLEDLDFKADEYYMQHLDRTRIPENAILITCVNNAPYTFYGVMTAKIDILADEDTGGFTLTDAKGKPVYFEVLEIKKNIDKRILSPINLPGVKQVNRYVIAFRTKLGAMARKTLIATPCGQPLSVENTSNKRTRNIENEFLKVKVNTNGSVNITDKKSGVTYTNALVIEDHSDHGDLYRFISADSPDRRTSEKVKAKVELVRSSKLIKSIKITYCIEIERVGVKNKLPVELLLTLNAGSGQLDVDVTLDNRFGNHRTRILFPTGIMSDKNYAGQPFDTVIRKKISDFENDETHPDTAFVGIDAEGRGVALLNEGLYEYEHVNDENGTLALTIIRCTDRISAYMANAETPDGQCIGKHTLKLAVYPYSLDHVSGGVSQAADRFINKPYAAVQHRDHNKFVGGRPFVQSAAVPFNFFRPIEHAEIVLPLEAKAFDLTQNRQNAMMLTAYKGAEDGVGQIIRLFNTTSEHVSFEIKMGYKIKNAYLTSLSEKNSEPIKVIGGKKLSLTAKPKQIITVKVVN
jgi:alpha-mannosidase